MQNTDKLEYQRDEHRVHLIVYHLIWCPRRRKPVLMGDIARRARQIIEEKCKEKGWVILTLAIQPDHIHLFVRVWPSDSASLVIKEVKGITARSKKMQLKKLKNQVKDIEHKQTSRLVSTLYEEGVQTVVIGDVRDIRHDLDVGSTNNQKLHQWSHGTVRHLLTYKAERHGMVVALQEESYTSKTCPVCGHRRKSKPQGRVFHCTNKTCGFTWHRDGVGACNIRRKYLDLGPVVGAMAPPTGMRFRPHTRVARSEKE